MAIINAEDAYILEETGAQIDKVAGLYYKNENMSPEEKAQARANIGASASNPNLLDNPWFTVNQRGLDSYGEEYSYGLDRWKKSGGSFTTNVTSDGVQLVREAATALQYEQLIEAGRLVAGELYTASIIIDGALYHSTFVYDGPSSEAFHVYTQMSVANRYRLRVRQANLDPKTVEFVINSADARIDTVSIRAAKLEKGAVSTLAADGPPNYAQELAKCQRYLFVYKGAQFLSTPLGFTEGNKYLYAMLSLPVPMRVRPSVSVRGTWIMWGSSIAYPLTGIHIDIGMTPQYDVHVAVLLATQQGNGSGIYNLECRDDTNSALIFGAEL